MTGGAVSEAQPTVDLVRIRADDGERDLTLEEFLMIPLRLRVRYLLNQDARFYAAGIEVPPSTALGSMRLRGA